MTEHSEVPRIPDRPQNLQIPGTSVAPMGPQSSDSSAPTNPVGPRTEELRKPPSSLWPGRVMLVLTIIIVPMIFFIDTGGAAAGLASFLGTFLILGLQVYTIRREDGEFVNVPGLVRRAIEGESPEWNARRANRVNTIVDVLNACAVLLLAIAMWLAF